MLRSAWRVVAMAVLVLGATLAYGWWLVDGPGRTADQPIAELPGPLGQAEFSLLNQDGEAVGPDTLLGRPSMVFFGFTFCPEVCPTTLSDISGWLDELGPDAERLNVVFITVDPERDTVSALADYMKAFHPQIQGWTGTPDQIARAAEAFRVRYEKMPGDDGGYVMNHTASVLLYGASGEFVSAVDYHEPREYALPKIRRALRTLPERNQDSSRSR